jgi:hypothetical protein
MNRTAAVLAGAAKKMAEAGIAGVRVFDSGSSFRHVDKYVATSGWRVEGGTPEQRARVAAYLVAKERAFGLPDTRDGGVVEGVYSVSEGEDAYGERYALVIAHRITRPRVFVRRAA